MTDPISVQELSELMRNQAVIELLDVRRKGDLERSPQQIAGARWRDPEAIDQWYDTVPKNQDVVVYCVKGGPVSQSVAEKLARQGCRVKFLAGGIKAWRESGTTLE